MPGGTWRFEIDNAAFALWGIIAHVGWVTSAAPAEYLRGRWEGIRRAADLLARWRDPETGLQAPAQEDDNAAYTQTLHGAVTVFGALDMAGRAARLVGEDADAARWEARATELRAAILEHLYDAGAGRFVASTDDALNPGSQPTGQTAWLVWPMRVLPWDDPRVDAQLRADLEAITPAIELRTEGGAYFMKNTVALALARGDDQAIRPALVALLDRLAAQATPGTHHYGEVMLVVDGDDGPRADQRVSTPHLWEGALFYLTAMALYAPDAFLRYDDVLPPSRVGFEWPPPSPPDAGTPPDATPPATDAAPPVADVAPPAADAVRDLGGGGGCDCRVGGGGGGLALWLLALAAVRRRRR